MPHDRVDVAVLEEFAVTGGVALVHRTVGRQEGQLAQPEPPVVLFVQLGAGTQDGICSKILIVLLIRKHSLTYTSNLWSNRYYVQP